ncbi:MAG: alpha/beta hydrolase [Ancylobacter novellus]|uniref:Alpha/beta hydrolase n=1 Tax=Ancylobacter novellus TaxID=921 RepID=A0A2W5R5Q4_ANCNO|nr:MAG: alpha/beta hydrolase [Ancylobacter novellus]
MDSHGAETDANEGRPSRSCSGTPAAPVRRHAYKIRRLIVTFAGLIAFASPVVALSPLDLLNGVARLGTYRAFSGISYGPGPRHQLDVYQPAGVGTSRPVTVIPDYRLYPQVRFPAFLEDAAAAVRWVHDHAADYGGDPERIVLVGHSAGAHIAAMLALNPRWLAGVGLDAHRDIKGMAGLAGPYDFLPLKDDTLKMIFGPTKQLARTQPITFASGHAVPLFLAAGRRDTTVDPGNSTRLAESVRTRGGVTTVRLYDGVDHRTLLGAFSPPLRFLAPVLADTAAFVRSVTGDAPPR